MKKKTKAANKKSLDQPVLDIKGKKVETMRLNEKVFDGVVNIPLLHQVVTAYRACQRSGTASVKTRAYVSGGGKKPWRQKGTGRARTGSIRNPLWRGGGIIFGPHPRDYSYKVPRGMKRSAIKSCLNSKFLEDNMIVVNEVMLDKPKTKDFRAVLESLNIENSESAIMILSKTDNNLKLASRNLRNVSLKSAGNFNAMDILRHKKLLIQESVLKDLMKDLQ